MENQALEAVINGRNATEEQIRVAEKKREENEIRIQKEREKRQKRAFLIQQGIEVAKVTIAGLNAAAAALTLPPVGLGPILGLPLAGLIKANTAISIAAILAQSIPAFFRGKDSRDPYTGMHTVNELPGQREIKIDKDGTIKLYGKGMQMDYSRAGDIIEPSPGAFMKNLFDPRTETNRRIMGTITGRGKTITEGTISRQDELFARMVEKSIAKGFRSAKNNININVTQPRPNRRAFTR